MTLFGLEMKESGAVILVQNNKRISTIVLL